MENEEKEVVYTFKEKVKKDDYRDKVLFARVRSGLYGKLWHLSKESGMSMSKLCEVCLEKYIDEIKKEVMQVGIDARKEKYGFR